MLILSKRQRPKGKHNKRIKDMKIARNIALAATLAITTTPAFAAINASVEQHNQPANTLTEAADSETLQMSRRGSGRSGRGDRGDG